MAPLVTAPEVTGEGLTNLEIRLKKKIQIIHLHLYLFSTTIVNS